MDERCDREQQEKEEKQKEKKTNNNNNKKVAAAAGEGGEKVSTKKGGGEGAGCPGPTTKTTNEEGHFEYTLGESLGPNDRFKILAPLGEGTFGKVL